MDGLFKEETGLTRDILGTHFFKVIDENGLSIGIGDLSYGYSPYVIEQFRMSEEEVNQFKTWVEANSNLIEALDNGRISLEEFKLLMFKANTVPTQEQKEIQDKLIEILILGR